MSDSEESKPLLEGPQQVTIGMCLLLIAVFVVTAWPVFLVPNPAIIDQLSLDFRAILMGHEYWRLITANLVHANLGHLGMNLFSLFIFSSLLEQQVGPRWLIAIMIAALAGCNVASYLFVPIPSIGASGIVYGIQAGFIFASGKEMLQQKSQSQLRTWHSLLGYIVVILLLNWMSPQYINTAGHLGGALLGGITGFLAPTPPSRTT